MIVYTVESRLLAFSEGDQEEGPTNCIITTTPPFLHPENETRCSASLPTTRRAQRVLERWLPPRTSATIAPGMRPSIVSRDTCGGGHPFAQALAKKTAPLAQRMRRDFGALSRWSRRMPFSAGSRERDSPADHRHGREGLRGGPRAGGRRGAQGLGRQ